MIVRSWRTSLRPSILAIIAMAVVVPASVFANTNEPIAQTGGMTTTFPLLGTTLTVDVSLDAVGNIDGVTLDPADALPTTTTGDHGVKFSNEDGTAKVTVKAKGDKLEIKARTTLADLQGPATWQANVFGPGTGSTVDYTIGVDGDGKPTITIDEVTVPDGVAFVIKASTSKGKHGKSHASARATVVFASNGFTKTLRISVDARKDGAASLKITLSGKDRQRLSGPLADLLGPRLWTAHLCDGTPVEVAYHVTDAAAVEFDSVTGHEATEKEKKHGFKVRFDGTRVGVEVRLKTRADGTYALKVNGKSGKCGDHHGDHDTKADKDSKGHKGDGDRGDKGRGGDGDSKRGHGH